MTNSSSSPELAMVWITTPTPPEAPRPYFFVHDINVNTLAESPILYTALEVLLNLYTFSSVNLLRLNLSNFQRGNTQLHDSLFLVN